VKKDTGVGAIPERGELQIRFEKDAAVRQRGRGREMGGEHSQKSAKTRRTLRSCKAKWERGRKRVPANNMTAVDSRDKEEEKDGKTNIFCWKR